MIGNLVFQRREILDQMILELVQKGPVKGTWNNTKTHARRYREFCTVLHLNPFPLTELQLCRFVAFLTFTLTSYNSVTNYLGGVRKLCTLARLPQPVCTGYLDHVLRGVKRLLARPVEQADPMTPQLLQKIAALVDTTNLKQVVIFTAMVVGFFLFLRSANLTCATQFSSFDPEIHITRGDIRMGELVALIELRFTKTIQFKERSLLMPILQVLNPAICPLAWLKYMLSMVPAPAQAPAFCFPTKQGLAALTYAQLSEQMKKWAGAVGHNPEKISPYSLRRGGCTWAFESNLPATAIRLLDDWSSDVFFRYISCSLQSRLNAMLQLTHRCHSL